MITRFRQNFFHFSSGLGLYTSITSTPTATVKLIPLPYRTAPAVNSGSPGVVELAARDGADDVSPLASGVGVADGSSTLDGCWLSDGEWYVVLP